MKSWSSPALFLCQIKEKRMMNNKTENRKQNIEHLAHLEKQEQK